MDSAEAEIVQVPSAMPVMVPAEYSQAPDGFDETVIVAVPPEGATAVTPTVASITKSEKVEGVRVGSLASNEEVAEIVALVDAVERTPSPTMLLPKTLTVYVPAATEVNSAVVPVASTLVTSAPEELIK